MIRDKAEGSVPPVPEETQSPDPDKPEPAPEPAPPPQLADYREEARKDVASLVSLARQLETRGNPQHALLAWERVLDSAAPDPARTAEAVQAIKRLRTALPDWNADPAASVAITLHAGTGKTTAETLAPVLEETARELSQASAGILKITSSVGVGNDIPGRAGPAPIALWLAGPDAESRSSEVFAFTNETPDTLRMEVARSLFTIIRNHLALTASLTVPEATTPEADPMEVMRTHVTRLGWLELGLQLNKTLE